MEQVKQKVSALEFLDQNNLESIKDLISGVKTNSEDNLENIDFEFLNFLGFNKSKLKDKSEEELKNEISNFLAKFKDDEKLKERLDFIKILETPNWIPSIDIGELDKISEITKENLTDIEELVKKKHKGQTRHEKRQIKIEGQHDTYKEEDIDYVHHVFGVTEKAVELTNKFGLSNGNYDFNILVRTFPELVKIKALFHDVAEDCYDNEIDFYTAFEDLRENLKSIGINSHLINYILSGVRGLTKDSRIFIEKLDEDGNIDKIASKKATKEAQQLNAENRLSQESLTNKLIKFADNFNNCSSLLGFKGLSDALKAYLKYRKSWENYLDNKTEEKLIKLGFLEENFKKTTADLTEIFEEIAGKLSDTERIEELMKKELEIKKLIEDVISSSEKSDITFNFNLNKVSAYDKLERLLSSCREDMANGTVTREATEQLLFKYLDEIKNK